MQKNYNNLYQSIISILKNDKIEISSIYLLAIVGGLVQLIMPLGIQSIIGFLMGGSYSTSLVLLIIVVIASVWADGYLQISKLKIIERIQQKLFYRYAIDYTEKIPNLKIDQLAYKGLPELVNRFFDVQSLQKSLSKLLLDIPIASIQIVFGLILISFYHPIFILFGAVLIIIIIMILRFTGKNGLLYSKEESTYKYKFVAHLELLAKNFITFKFREHNSLPLQKTDELVSKYLKSRNQHFNVLQIQYWSLIYFKLFTTISMLIAGVVLVINQKINIGQFIATEIVILSIINAVEKIVINLDQVYDALTAIDKISLITDKETENNTGTELIAEHEPMNIALEQVNFSYGNKMILDNCSATFNTGEKICIGGTREAGKFTLLKIIATLLPIQEGMYAVNGKNISQFQLHALRSGISFSTLDDALFTGSLIENLCFTKDQYDHEKLDQLLALFDLTDWANKHPEGLYQNIEANESWSYKLIRKLVLIRALYAPSKLLLMQDPTNGIEPQYAERLVQYIAQLPNTTCIISSADEFVCKHQIFTHYLLSNGKLEKKS
jgi:ABC-type bacteriocin/lantibiotic exporter with double-glycine peptidase domain